MTLWTGILLAAVICVALKAVGYLIPPRWFEAPAPSRIVDLLTVALLGALVAVQTLGVGQQIVLDARVPALVVAAGLLIVRAPFLVVVVGGLGAEVDLDPVQDSEHRSGGGHFDAGGHQGDREDRGDVVEHRNVGRGADPRRGRHVAPDHPRE